MVIPKKAKKIKYVNQGNKPHVYKINKLSKKLSTCLLYFGHPKNDRPGFVIVVEVLSEAGWPQVHIGLFTKVRLPREDEEFAVDILSTKMSNNKRADLITWVSLFSYHYN